MNKYLEMYKRLEDDWQNYLENNGKLTHEDMLLIRELVLKATAKKTITIKPIGTGTMEYPTYRIKCPTCNHQLPMKKNCISKNPPILYCDRCGQKIDWSE